MQLCQGKCSPQEIKNSERVRKILVAPSILACDLSNIGKEIKKAETAGADLIHIDIMDGHFVPNLTFGPGIVKSIRPWTSLPLDVHLMIDNPERFIGPFADAGADFLGVHIEVCKGKRMAKTLKMIKDSGVKKTIVLNPNTNIKTVIPFLQNVQMVLFMTVFPGFGSQRFISSVLKKISFLRKLWDGLIEVDGGINEETARLCIDAGANVIVAGTYIFGSKDMGVAIKSLCNYNTS